MSWIDKFISGFLVLVNGTEQVQPGAVNFIGATAAVVGDQLNLTVSGNTTAHYVVTELDAGLTNAHVPSGSASIQIAASVEDLNFACIFGTTTGTVCEGNDARLTHTSTGVADGGMSAGYPVALVSGGNLHQPTSGLGRCAGILLTGTGGPGATLPYQYFGPSIPIPYGAWVAKPAATDIGKPVYSALDGTFLLTLTKPVSGPYQEIGTVLFADAGANTTTIMINLQSEGP